MNQTQGQQVNWEGFVNQSQEVEEEDTLLVAEAEVVVVVVDHHHNNNLVVDYSSSIAGVQLVEADCLDC